MMRHAVGTGILAIVVLTVPAQAEDKTAQRAWDAGGRAAQALMVKMTPQRVTEGDARAWARQPIPAQGRPVAVQTATVPPPPPRVIREAQTLLTGLGYEPGPVDGVWNEATVQAYQKFLRDAGLPAAETLTPDTLRTLRTLAKFRGGGPERGEAVQPSAKAAPPDALHRAAKAGNLDGLKAALAAGADVNARDGRGWTALMHAVNKGYILLVAPLLAAKADLDVRGPDGATALFMAVAHGQTEIIALLMKAGADVSIKGPKGKTAVDVAQMSGDSAIPRALGIPQPGDVFRDCDACPEMVVVPAGSYLMGSPASEEGREDDEGPVHRVTIAQLLAVGKYEVTFAEWDACVAGGGCGGYRPNAVWGRGTRPVINVSWKDAQAYVRWLSEQTGQGYRLLSEAEWEYVARAGTTTPFHTGATISTEQANYDGNFIYGSGREGKYRERTVAVGSFLTNGFGLHDVLGNVWEWTQDCWNVGYGGAPADGRAWESGDCSQRVLRGGSWNYFPRDLRSANRGRNTSGYRYSDGGFRLARTLTP